MSKKIDFDNIKGYHIRITDRVRGVVYITYTCRVTNIWGKVVGGCGRIFSIPKGMEPRCFCGQKLKRRNS